MKLVKEDLTNQIIFEENKTNILIIENKKYFINFIEKLLLEIEGEKTDFSLFQDCEELKISEKIEIIKDIFSLDFSQKKIINKVYNELEQIAINSELLTSTKEIEFNLQQYIHKLIENYEHTLDFIEELNIKEIFKLFSIKLSKNFTNKLEEIVEYIELFSKVLNKEIFVLINFHIFFSKNEIIELNKQCFYKKIKLLFVENEKPDIILSEEKLFIIDNDLCEINLS